MAPPNAGQSQPQQALALLSSLANSDYHAFQEVTSYLSISTIRALHSSSKMCCNLIRPLITTLHLQLPQPFAKESLPDNLTVILPSVALLHISQAPDAPLSEFLQSTARFISSQPTLLCQLSALQVSCSRVYNRNCVQKLALCLSSLISLTPKLSQFSLNLQYIHLSFKSPLPSHPLHSLPTLFPLSSPLCPTALLTSPACNNQLTSLKLNFDLSPAQDFSALSLVLATLSCLRELRLNVFAIDREDPTTIPQLLSSTASLPHLTLLHLLSEEAFYACDTWIPLIIRHTSLRQLNLSQPPALHLSSLSSLQGLSSLALGPSACACYAWIDNLTLLTSLELRCESARPTSWPNLAASTNLVHLDLRASCSFLSSVVPQLTSVTSLALEGNEYIPSLAMTLLVMKLSSLPRLCSLKLQGIHCNDRSLHALSCLPGLTHLTMAIMSCDCVATHTLPSLRSLHITLLNQVFVMLFGKRLPSKELSFVDVVVTPQLEDLAYFGAVLPAESLKALQGRSPLLDTQDQRCFLAELEEAELF